MPRKSTAAYTCRIRSCGSCAALLSNRPLHAVPQTPPRCRLGPRAPSPTILEHSIRGACATAALGDATVTVVGSSVELQLELAVQCALAAADRCARANRWRHWGWGTFHLDNQGCSQQRTADPDDIASGCAAHGRAFEQMLATTDVVVVGYNPQFCFRHSPRLWSSNLRAMLPLLERFARRPGKLAFLREPPAEHFADDGGSFNASHHRSRTIDEPCVCQPSAADDPRDTSLRATREMYLPASQLAPSVHVLPFYNATKARYDMHPGPSRHVQLPPAKTQP